MRPCVRPCVWQPHTSPCSRSWQTGRQAVSPRPGGFSRVPRLPRSSRSASAGRPRLQASPVRKPPRARAPACARSESASPVAGPPAVQRSAPGVAQRHGLRRSGSGSWRTMLSVQGPRPRRHPPQPPRSSRRPWGASGATPPSQSRGSDVKVRRQLLQMRRCTPSKLPLAVSACLAWRVIPPHATAPPLSLPPKTARWL